jgi:glucose-6-phosphate-specific signal transduction histidine kinase
VRGVIGEVRDTLYDLRTDVTDEQDLAADARDFLDRVQARSDLDIRLDAQASGRLPLLQERELWRVAQEAVTNVERHAHATKVAVTWRCDGERGVLIVADDGIGFPSGRAGRLDSYGIIGMRERAASIGAALDISSGWAWAPRSAARSATDADLSWTRTASPPAGPPVTSRSGARTTPTPRRHRPVTGRVPRPADGPRHGSPPDGEGAASR